MWATTGPGKGEELYMLKKVPREKNLYAARRPHG